MVDHIIQVLNEQLHTFLMVSLNGEAKEMARIATLNGIEAWRSLNFRWNRKSRFGATQISEMICKITPAKTADEVYQKLNQLERLAVMDLDCHAVDKVHAEVLLKLEVEALQLVELLVHLVSTFG